MTKHFALIFQDTNIVENVIVADDNFIAPEGRFLVALPERPQIGGLYDPASGTFAPPTESLTTVRVQLLPADVADLLSILGGANVDSVRGKQLAQKITVNGVEISQDE